VELGKTIVQFEILPATTPHARTYTLNVSNLGKRDEGLPTSSHHRVLTEFCIQHACRVGCWLTKKITFISFVDQEYHVFTNFTTTNLSLEYDLLSQDSCLCVISKRQSGNRIIAITCLGYPLSFPLSASGAFFFFSHDSK
jgi:hypothetical protein